MSERYSSKHSLRAITAASLFDGHDASINIMRRILQAAGVEVIHLGHNRTAMDVAIAAIQEDVQLVALSSYQGGHMEYFRYIRQLIDERGGEHIRLFGGGGGVIVPDEIKTLQDEGTMVRVYSPEDGRLLGLEGLIDDMIERSDFALTDAPDWAKVCAGDVGALARLITLVEAGLHSKNAVPVELKANLTHVKRCAPVVGITGTGGAGKSSLTDELLLRWLRDVPDTKVAILSVDPTRRRTGGALLGDRIRMNAVDPERVFFRSLATREQKGELSGAIREAVQVCQAAGFDLIIVETSGIGQGDADITEVADLSLYVMTPEFGAASQLEKIDMLDYADFIVVNKFEKRGALDALRDVRKQYRRNRSLWDGPDEDLPVFGTVASRFADIGVDALFVALLARLRQQNTSLPVLEPVSVRFSPASSAIIPSNRARYLAEISEGNRVYHRWVTQQASLASQRQHLQTALALVPSAQPEISRCHDALLLDPAVQTFLDGWAAVRDRYKGDEFSYWVRGREIKQPLVVTSLSQQKIPRVVLPQTDEHADLVRFWGLENLPGSFPYTAGVFPLKRKSEEPKRMFAGEGGPQETNTRFHLLCEGESVHRLSTAFDSVTLYGEDPHERPDIYGKVGESGVSVPHLDDMKILYAGFDLLAPTTSVSMTINGPAPMVLAMFLCSAIDQHRDRWTQTNGRAPSAAESETLRREALSMVRGTVQADILKEDQAQNTCIFSTEFALKMMGDIQSYFVEEGIRNFYSVSISGYHIAEAGANPISQLAFTLSNGFTLVEAYLARGMAIDDFAPNLSFFFSNGLDPEYTVIGRVARRIWAVAMRERYGANARSQKLKYHIQTSGRSLHAREVQFNDIRTTLQALLALNDNCNSLHTNAYDEAVTTPTEESVRRAMAIQLIINREFGASFNENSLQGSYFVDHMTNLVEAAVLEEFDRINERGGVLGAMERQYQRMKIQEESLYYEHKKHDGSLPIVGINTFLDLSKSSDEAGRLELRRASSSIKDRQIESVHAFQAKHSAESEEALERLKRVALGDGNIFAELMHTVRVATLGQISQALYQTGGKYRRNL